MIALLDREAVRARRRPGALFWVWGWQLVSAWLVATPLHGWARSAWGSHPDGDANLFRPGAHALLTWLGNGRTELPVVLKTSLVLALVLALAGQVVTGALVASLGSEGDRGRAPPGTFALGVGLASFAPLSVIGALVTVVQAILVAIGLLIGGAATSKIASEARAFAIEVAIVALFALAALAAGVVGDLARVALAREITSETLRGERTSLVRRVRAAFTKAFATTRTDTAEAMVGWAWRAAVSFAFLAVGALAGDVAGAKGVWALFAIHQIVIAARGALRASWLANALRLSS